MNYHKEVIITGELRKGLEQCNRDTYMLGRLAENRMFYPATDTNEMIGTKKGATYAIAFHLEPLSDLPNPINNLYDDLLEKLMFVGLDNHQTTAIKDIGYSYLVTDEKVDFWSKKLKGKLIRFKPKVIFRKGKNPMLNLEIDGIEDGELKEGVEYKAIPISDIQDVQLFEDRLTKGQYVKLAGYNHVFNSPQFVICGDYIYTNFSHWAKHQSETAYWKVDERVENIKRMKIDDLSFDFYSYIGGGNKSVIFIEREMVEKLQNEICDFGQSISSKLSNVATESKGLKDSIIQFDSSAGKLTQPIMVKPTVSVQQKNPNVKGEVEFLKNLKLSALQEGLVYHPMDLVNFHVSVKTSPLTILEGMSGTGKTQLVRVFAKTLGLNGVSSPAQGANRVSRNLLFLPITPSYLEPSDVLGYYNHTTNSYVPAETGLVDILIDAEKNPNELFMVIFDEMNLSQIEHWFSPFLSLLELKSEERNLMLYSEQTPCLNGERYKNSIHLGDNIIFVGTINLDETTKELSDRLLDRVNVVNLRKTSFSLMKQQASNSNKQVYNYGFKDFRGWVSDEAEANAYTEEELLFFDELHELINEYDNQKGVSYRLINRIGAYINNLPVIEGEADQEFKLTKAQAIDLGIKQRLLTKIKGNERQIGELIGTKMSASDLGEKGELAILFESERAQEISSFEETLKEINRKALELGVYGFTN